MENSPQCMEIHLIGLRISSQSAVRWSVRNAFLFHEPKMEENGWETSGNNI